MSKQPREALAELYSWIRDEEIPMSDRLGRICDRLEALASATPAQADALPDGAADKMHFAICHAVSVCNQSMDMARSEDGRKISDILRRVLVEVADDALATTEQQAAALPHDTHLFNEVLFGIEHGWPQETLTRLAGIAERIKAQGSVTQAPEAAPQPTPGPGQAEVLSDTIFMAAVMWFDSNGYGDIEHDEIHRLSKSIASTICATHPEPQAGKGEAAPAAQEVKPVAWVASRNGENVFVWSADRPARSPWFDGPGNWIPLYAKGPR